MAASVSTVASPALAQGKPGSSSATQAVKPLAPEVFKPGKANDKPEGSPIPAAMAKDLPTDDGMAGVAEPGEVVGRRTEDSTTFVTDDGTFETTFYAGPVNYQDANGDFQPIDNTLVPADKPGALRNKAGGVEVTLPGAIGDEAVQAAKGGTSVSFTLRGAKEAAAPVIGLPKGLADKAGEAASDKAESDKAARSSATYAGVLPGVDVAYAATPQGVKEDVVLAGPSSPTSFDFTVVPSPGLSARESGGGIDFVDAKGVTQAGFAAPFAYDASFEATGAEGSFTEGAVTLGIVETDPELVVRLEADPAWLSAPGRAWPVVIDPLLVIDGSAPDTYLNQAYPDNNYNTLNRLNLSGGSADRRILYAKDIAASFDEPVTLFSATLQLYAPTDTSALPAAAVGVHEMATRDWNSGAATWNTRLAPGLRWANPGGDFVAQPSFVNPKVTGTPGWRSWPMTELAQKWLDGTPFSGVMLKYENEASAPAVMMGFASTSEANTALIPRIVVRWEPLEGVRAPYGFEDIDLGAAGQASVNVASGNLTLADADMGIAGTGLAATVGRTYQSRAYYMGSVGARWRMWPQSEERVGYADFTDAYAHNGDIMWHGGPEEVLVFSQDDTGTYTAENPNGTYTSPPGYRGTMVLTSEAGLPVFKLTDHDSGTVRNFYSSGYLRDVTDRNGNKISFGYTCDIAANECYMVSMTDTQGRVTTFARAAAGAAGQYKVTTLTDPTGRVHRYAYDRAGEQANLASYTDPAGGVTSYGYSGTLLGLLSRVTDPNGNVTTFTYDSKDRLSTLTRSGSTWSFDYSVAWQTKVTDPNAKVTTHYFDRQGKVTKVIDALGHQRDASYDSRANVIDRTSAMSNKWVGTFDANDNLTSSALPTGATTAMAYANPAFKYFPTRLTDPQGNAWDAAYDAKGNLASISDSMPTPGVSTLAYNANGTVSSSTDAKGAVTTFGYDAAGNRTSVTPPAPLGATTIAYDSLSRVTSVTDGKGQVTTTTYDALDRPIQASVGGITVTSRYDAGGRLVERSDPGGTTTFLYDAQNRLTEERLPGGRVNAYTYDGLGNLKTITDATGTVSYAYNAVNLVTSLAEPGGATTTFAYDNDDNRTITTYPNGVTQAATYDDSARLLSITGAKAGTTLTSFAYTYTRAGADTALRQSVTDKDDNATAYTYDPLVRLTNAVTTQASGPVLSDYGYGYDPVGNRTTETANGVTTSSTFNAADQLSDRGGVGYTYDANGNQTGSSAGQALAYNPADQTTSLTAPAGSPLAATYAGLGQSQRNSAGDTTFTNTLLGISAASDGATTGYTRDPGGTLVGIRGTSASYYLFDGLGSVAAVTDSNGAVTNSYAYDPYGVTTETKAPGTDVFNPWRYTGQYQDVSTGLYKIGARYYQPELGRWTQADPSGLDRNAYVYVGGNPVSFVDPTGLEFLGIDCPFGETDSGGCNGASREAIGTGLSIAGTAAGIAAIPVSGGASLALSAGALGLGTAGAAVQCGAPGAVAAAGIGIIGGGVAGAFTEGGLKAAGVATGLSGEVANYAVCSP